MLWEAERLLPFFDTVLRNDGIWYNEEGRFNLRIQVHDTRNKERKRRLDLFRVSRLMNNKGFTIIELIVVIAIIAVLAAIALTNVTQYIGKGKDAAIKEQVKQILTVATDFFTTNGTYTGMCSPGTKCNQIESNIVNLGGQSNPPNIKTDGSAYCMDFVLSDGVSKWCVDNTGYNGSQDNCTFLHFSCQ